MLNQQMLIEALEPLVDQSSLSDVLLALGLVAGEKSEHILINWQDKPLAKVWDKAHTKIMRTAEGIDV